MYSSATPSAARNVSRGTAIVFALCWTAVLFDGLDMFIYGSVLPHMLETRALGLEPGQAGELGSYATFGMLVGALAAGTVCDRIGRKKTMIACVTIFSLASSLCALAPNVTIFGLGRTLAGLGLGGLLPTAITMVSDFAPRHRTALAVGGVMTAHSTGGILSAYVATWLIDPLGWRSAFWACVVPLLFVPVLIKAMPESLSFLMAKGRTHEAQQTADRYGATLPDLPATTAAPRRGDAVAALFRDGQWIQTLLYWLASFGGLLLVYGVATWLPTLMRAEGYGLGSALQFVVVFNLGGIAGLLAAGKASDRFGASRISAVWFLATAASVYLLSIHMALALTFTVVFLAGFFLNSAQSMIYATVSIGSTPDNRATAVGWTSGIGRFGAVFGPWLGGQLLASGNGSWGFTAFALTGLFSMTFIGLAAVRTRAREVGGRPAETAPVAAL